MRYVINLVRNGEHVFSTSRNSIGSDKEKLATVCNLLSVLLEADADLKMEVFRIGTATAVSVNVNGETAEENANAG